MVTPTALDAAVELVVSSPTSLCHVLEAVTAQVAAGEVTESRVIDALTDAHQAVVRAVMAGALARQDRS